MQQNTQKHLRRVLGQKLLVKLNYKKYYRKTSLKQPGVGDFFLNEIITNKPKVFLEVGVFHGVTARNVCEVLHNIHGEDFKYIGLDLFEESDENKNEVIPNTTFSSNPIKQFYYKYIKRQNPYSLILKLFGACFLYI